MKRLTRGEVEDEANNEEPEGEMICYTGPSDVEMYSETCRINSVGSVVIEPIQGTKGIEYLFLPPRMVQAMLCVKKGAEIRQEVEL